MKSSVIDGLRSEGGMEFGLVRNGRKWNLKEWCAIRFDLPDAQIPEPSRDCVKSAIDISKKEDIRGGGLGTFKLIIFRQ